MPKDKMRILVTGGAGFIGSAFIRLSLNQYSDRCERIVNLDALTYAANLASVESVENDQRYSFIEGNILDEELVTEILVSEKITHVVHCAAESHVDRSIAGPRTFARTNVMGTIAMLEAVRTCPSIHFHHVSTDEVYGALGEEGIFNEDSPYRPNSPYSASKASSDHFVRAYAATYGIKSTISHCSNNFGPFQYPEKLIPVVIKHALEKQPIPVYGKGMQVRDWIHVDEHAHALFAILERAPSGQTYTIGGQTEKRNIDLVRAILRVIATAENLPIDALEPLIQFVIDRPGHDYRYAISSEKIEKELGWKRLKSFDAALEETVRWYLSNSHFLKLDMFNYEDSLCDSGAS